MRKAEIVVVVMIVVKMRPKMSVSSNRRYLSTQINYTDVDLTRVSNDFHVSFSGSVPPFVCCESFAQAGPHGSTWLNMAGTVP